MRRSLLAALLAVFSATSLWAGSLFVLELKGGSRVFALDRPMQAGRVVVFHRHPDGVYTSISADEVVKIVASSSAGRSEKSRSGETIFLGSDTGGAPRPASPPPAEPPAAGLEYYAPDYGYGMYWGYGGPSTPPPQRPPPLPRGVPTNIGPNGFPILAPPGSPGSVPPPIGSNGFPDPRPR